MKNIEFMLTLKRHLKMETIEKTTQQSYSTAYEHHNICANAFVLPIANRTKTV